MTVKKNATHDINKNIECPSLVMYSLYFPKNPLGLMGSKLSSLLEIKCIFCSVWIVFDASASEVF